MALVGHIGDFVESQESWSQYSERLEQFFLANSIPDDKKASVLLATIGPTAFRTLGNIVSPKKPSEERYERLISVMSEFYNPKPLVTVLTISILQPFSSSGGINFYFRGRITKPSERL